MQTVLSTPSVSVIVPVYQGGTVFRVCLESLTRLEPPADEIVVVADGDTDGSRELARSFGAVVIERDTPAGPAAARNTGARVAQGTLLFFVDADVAVPRDAIAQLLAAFGSEPSLTALIGSYDDAPAAPEFLSQYKNLLHHYVHQTASDTASTFWGACGAIRRDAFLELGGFDERYREASIEDIELGYRLIAAGRRIRMHKPLQVKHLKRWTARSLVATDFFRRALPWTALLLRERHMPNDLNLKHGSRLSVVCVFGLLLAVPGAVLRRRYALLAAVLAGALTIINARFYRFLARKRGWWFAIRAIPWHWLSFAYSGVALVIGVLRYAAEPKQGKGERL